MRPALSMTLANGGHHLRPNALNRFVLHLARQNCQNREIFFAMLNGLKILNSAI
jgi:hypothetical protein